MKTYTYSASFVRAIDGDTLDLEVDLGFRIRHQIRVRLEGINACELNSPVEAERALAIASRDLCAQILGIQYPLSVTTYKDPKDKYGRWLAKVEYFDDFGHKFDLATELVNRGLAKIYPKT